MDSFLNPGELAAVVCGEKSAHPCSNRVLTDLPNSGGLCYTSVQRQMFQVFLAWAQLQTASKVCSLCFNFFCRPEYVAIFCDPY